MDTSSPSTEVFYCYYHTDEALRDELETYLSLLRRQGVIRGWHDRRIDAGTEWTGQIDQHLEAADIILLLVSAAFLASDYCYDIEMKRAMERHEKGEARVIPVILRPVDSWQAAPFGKLQALPTGGKPVTSWQNRDDAFADIARGIREAVSSPMSRAPNPPRSRPYGTLGSDYRDQPDTLTKVSLSYPRFASKGFSVLFVVIIYNNAKRRAVLKRVRQAQRGLPNDIIVEERREVLLNRGEEITIRIHCPCVDLVSDSKRVVLHSDINQYKFVGTPMDGCNPGTQWGEVTITDSSGRFVCDTITFELQVKDYVIDHISRPLARGVAVLMLLVIAAVCAAAFTLKRAKYPLAHLAGLTSASTAVVLTSLTYRVYRHPIPARLLDKSRKDLIGKLTGLSPSDFATLVALIPGAASETSRHGTVAEQVTELVRWAESRRGPGLSAVREALVSLDSQC